MTFEPLRSLSIVIPAYNEEKRLPGTLDRVLAWLDRRALGFSELIVVDDGSRDNTAGVAESRPPVRVLRNPGNRGKGYAVRHGMLDARGDWVLYSDADLSTPIEEADRLYDAAMKSGAAIAIGSRAVDRSLVTVHQSSFREYSGRAFNLVMRTITGLPFSDTQCGFKLYRRDAAQKVFSRQKLDGFSFDVEDLYLAKKAGVKAIEVPVHWANVEGTKVSMGQGIKSFTDLVRIRMGR
ncbi:MAG: dolichyl-phosphate beta-glucosyltransferase [Bryobacteraceae bacterium]